MFDVAIFTDGACAGNPGVGGYGAIISCNGKEHVIRGMSKEITTNNRMELTAVIEAIKALKKPCNVSVYTDSQYIIRCVSHDRDWLTCSTRKNNDLWLELITAGLKGQHKIKFVKVSGHSGIVQNERCDKIAEEQIVKARHAFYENN